MSCFTLKNKGEVSFDFSWFVQPGTFRPPSPQLEGNKGVPSKRTSSKTGSSHGKQSSLVSRESGTKLCIYSPVSNLIFFLMLRIMLAMSTVRNPLFAMSRAGSGWENMILNGFGSWIPPYAKTYSSERPDINK